MELININNEYYFDSTLKLKSSPAPILFIPFGCCNEYNCSYCGNIYSWTKLFCQKYCRNCLFRYIKNLSDYFDNEFLYLGVYICSNNTLCNEHEATRNKTFCSQNI